jgi:hypothetical protein
VQGDSSGASRTRTGDLLGAMPRSAHVREKPSISSAFAGDVKLPRNSNARGYAAISGDSATSGQKWLKSTHEISGGSSYRGRMPQRQQRRTDADPRTMRTKAGEVLTADLADALAAEAEQGYELTKARRHRIKEPEASPQGSTVADAAPYDDEELTDDDLRAVRAARSAPAVPWSDAEAELGSD